MRNEIISNLDNPGKLEKLYRDNKATFKREFNNLYPAIQETTVARIWNERLNFGDEEISWGTGKELIFIILASLFAGLLAKIPEFTGIDEDFFYPRNVGFIVFPLMAAWFAWKQKMQPGKMLAIVAALVISVLYINLLPDNPDSDTLILACIHLPLILWAMSGLAFVGGNPLNHEKRLDFLRYNGDLVVMTTILLIAGGLLTGLTIGLFKLIEIDLENFYMKYIVVMGLAASPIIGTYLVQTNPQLVNKVSPVIARVFTPLVFVTLVIYLVAVIVTGKDPYNDREFLLIFNALLIGVMALILFSISEISKKSGNRLGVLLLFGLSVVTVIINGIALSAILFRIAEWGITPNRLAVAGINILFLINLLLVSYRLFRTLKERNATEKVEASITSFLPVYILWAILVTFIFPVLFNFI